MRTSKSIENYSTQIEELRSALAHADAIVIGAGSGLSTAAGFAYSGPRFETYFADFIEKYGYRDMYSAGFYPYETLEEHWAYWSRHIYYNRYVPAPYPVYQELLELVSKREYFVLTTNVDHCFQRAGFDKKRLFYTQGDYGLWQCAQPCHQKTYDNEETVRQMIAQQRDMRIPSKLVPHCPICKRPMAMNLRYDSTFVEDQGWHEAAARYQGFLHDHRRDKLLLWELGVGLNTPGIIKYPFWKLTAQNPQATYACVNLQSTAVPQELSGQSICLACDVGAVIKSVGG